MYIVWKTPSAWYANKSLDTQEEYSLAIIKIIIKASQRSVYSHGALTKTGGMNVKRFSYSHMTNKWMYDDNKKNLKKPYVYSSNRSLSVLV